MTRAGKTGLTAIVWLAVIFVAIPLGLLIVRSLSNRWPWPEIIPSDWSARGWERLFSGNLDIWRLMAGSIALSLTVSGLSVVISTMAARAFALYEFRGKGLLEAIVFLPVAVPATAFGMGSHLLFIRLGLSGSVTAVVICHLITALPFAVRIMTEVTRLGSGKLEEQAQILGAGAWRQFLHGSLPIIAPGIVSAAAVSFLMSYTQYFLTMLIGGGKVRTLSVVVMPLITGSDHTVSSACSLMFIASTLGVFLVFQLVSNLVARLTGNNLAQ